MCVYACTVLFYLYNNIAYSNVYDVEITISNL